jgi:hypothetical protein
LPYSPVEDIPNIHKVAIRAKKSDASMRSIINSTRYTLNNPSNLKKASDYKREVSGLLRDQLLMFSITHSSIREIVKGAYRHKIYPIVGDALSLAREQVEKVFIIASLLDNPNKAFKKYLRASWKTKYEEYLLQTEEHSENERFNAFLSETLPKRLENLRHYRNSRGRRKILVSKFAIRVLKFNWNNPGAKNPPWFKRKGGIQGYIRDYFEFASPGRSARNIKDQALRRFLYRWHKEYTFLSQYTHVTVGKMIFAHMSQQKDLNSQEPIKDYSERFAIRAVHTSYTATAAACAIALNGVSNTFGADKELKEFWEQLIGFSLLSKALWNMHIKGLLG